MTLANIFFGKFRTARALVGFLAVALSALTNPAVAANSSGDVLLRALKEEMERSKAKLKMDKSLAFEWPSRIEALRTRL